MKTRTLLIFAAVGVTAALLLNTKEGKKLTKDIMDSADDLAGNLNKMTGKASGQLSDLKSYVSKEVTGLAEDARKKIVDILNQGSSAIKDGKATV